MEFNLFGYKVTVVRLDKSKPVNWSEDKLRSLAHKIDSRIGRPSRMMRVKILRTYMPTKAEPGSDESIANLREAMALCERMWLDGGYGDVA